MRSFFIYRINFFMNSRIPFPLNFKAIESRGRRKNNIKSF